MKNKNGFTLVELLAVVILLSVISLIVVPQVMKLVNYIKKGAAEDSVYGYINAILYKITLDEPTVSGNKITDGTYNVGDILVNVKGSLPKSGSFDIKRGKVVNAIFCVGNYRVVYEKNKAVATKVDDCNITDKNPQKNYYNDSEVEDVFIYKYNNTNNTNSTLKNIVGNYDASLVGTVNSDYGLYFNGTSDYALIKEFNYQSFTIEATFRVEELSNNPLMVIGNCDRGGYDIYVQNNKIVAEAYIDGNYKSITYSDIEIDKIYTTTISVDNGLFIFYVNGEEIGRYNGGSYEYPENDTILAIGVNPIGNKPEQDYFMGYLLSARGYSKALSSQVVKENYEIDLNNFERPEIELDRRLLFEYNSDNTDNTNLILKDESSNKIDATINGATLSKDGIIFNGKGANDYITIPYKSLRNLTYNATFRILDVTSEAEQNIISNTQNGGCSLALLNSNKKLKVECYLGGNYRTIYSKDPIEFNKVYTASITFSGGSYKLYLNGELQGSETYFNYTNPNNDILFVLGAEPDAGSVINSFYLFGSIYNISVYERALNVKEITKIHTELQNKYSGKTGNLDTIPLLVSYDFNKIVDSKLTDLSGNGIDGTIYGASKTDKGLYFDGVDDYVKIKSFSLNKFTFIVKFSLDEANTRSEADVFADYQNGGLGLSLNSDNSISAQAHINGGYRVIKSKVLELNHEYKAVMVFDSNTFKFYLDDELIGTYENVSYITYSNKSLFLGNEPSNSDAPENCYFKGYIKTFKIYNYPLTLEQIKNN